MYDDSKCVKKNSPEALETGFLLTVPDTFNSYPWLFKLGLREPMGLGPVILRCGLFIAALSRLRSLGRGDGVMACSEVRDPSSRDINACGRWRASTYISIRL